MERTYTPVRALERGLDLLLALNRLGRARVSILAAEAGIDRTTTYRLLDTLAAKGMVVRSDSDDSYMLSAGVRRLSDGYTLQGSILGTVAATLKELLAAVTWPSEYATFAGGAMVIQESTHPFSPFSVHRGMIGRSRPLMHSALGRAMLAGASPERRAAMLEVAARSGVEDAADAQRPPVVAGILHDFEARGYAASAGDTEAKISAIALPVIVHGEAVGAINIAFFRSTFTIDQAAARFLQPFRTRIVMLQQRIEAGEGIAGA